MSLRQMLLKETPTETSENFMSVSRLGIDINKSNILTLLDH